MKNNVRLYLSLMLLAITTPLLAQKFAASQYKIEVEDWNLMKGKDSLYVSFSLLSKRMDISSNQSVRLFAYSGLYPFTNSGDTRSLRLYSFVSLAKLIFLS